MTKTAELMAKEEKDITVGDFLALSKAQRGALMYRLNKRLSNQMYGMRVDVHLHPSLDRIKPVTVTTTKCWKPRWWAQNGA